MATYKGGDVTVPHVGRQPLPLRDLMPFFSQEEEEKKQQRVPGTHDTSHSSLPSPSPTHSHMENGEMKGRRGLSRTAPLVFPEVIQWRERRLLLRSFPTLNNQEGKRKTVCCVPLPGKSRRRKKVSRFYQNSEAPDWLQETQESSFSLPQLPRPEERGRGKSEGNTGPLSFL